MRQAKYANTPGILEVNAPLIDEQCQYRGLVGKQSAERVAARCFQDAHAVAAVSNEVADYVRSFADTGDKVAVLPNGVDAFRFKKRGDEIPGPGHRFTVGFVGSLKPWHGIEILIEAFKHFKRSYPHGRLMIVGDGPERDNIVQHLHAHGLSQVTELTGAVKPTEVSTLLAQMDVAVAPYPASERFYFSPLKIYEYMAAGLPVVASDVGQIAETVTDEVHGLLCPPGDPIALADALLCLLNDAALRRRMGKAARQKILKEHTWTHVAQQAIAMTGTESGDFENQRRACGHDAF